MVGSKRCLGTEPVLTIEIEIIIGGRVNVSPKYLYTKRQSATQVRNLVTKIVERFM